VAGAKADPDQLSGLSKVKGQGEFGHTSPTNGRQESRRCKTVLRRNKQTVLSNRPYIATFFLFLVVLLLACSKGKEGPPASVPADCQQFLDKYFDAWKSKDIAKLQAVSFYLSPEDRSRLPEGSLEMWRESKNKLVTENFERVTSAFGDFKSYEVLRAKTTTISPQDQLAANTIGSGIHTELVCKAKFSKKHDAHVGLHLIKETEGSQYIVAAWNIEAEP
jgi:hypothetical protein